MAAPFRYRQRVRYHECDPQGVVFNANYLAYFDVTMTELWRELGGYQAMVDDGADMVVAEARLRYLAPLRFDDEFDGVLSVTKLGDTSLGVGIELVRGDVTMVEGELRYVFIETGGGTKAPIPDSIRSALGNYSPH